MKRTPLKRGRRRSLTAAQLERADRFRQAAQAKPCAVCGADPWPGVSQAHHVVEAQELRRRKLSEDDPRNALPLCGDCHERHTNRSRPVPFRKLRAENVSYAYEVLGDFAGDYLKRKYPMDETEEQT